eukprot:764501-Hanusia_phi.AAC.2
MDAAGRQILGDVLTGSRVTEAMLLRDLPQGALGGLLEQRTSAAVTHVQRDSRREETGDETWTDNPYRSQRNPICRR